ncbi:hypothetical protein pipiens_020185 [Culex pipiens pipiens]|uniref:Uncharacterized protein n=1 Tax=Culex pipiens pipiens TaxID=38569 RepID=A0ABD1D816_CULPP
MEKKTTRYGKSASEFR